MIELKDIYLAERKVLSVFDFDDTIAKSDAWVYVLRAGRITKKLNPAEFAVYKPRPGESFDFREFDRPLRNPRLIKKNADLLRKQLDKARRQARGTRKVTILTARRLGAPVTSFLKTMGIDAYVVPIGSADPKLKADWIEQQIKKGYDTVYFMDDSNKNISAVKNMLRRYPNVQSITKLIKEGSASVTYGADAGEPDTGFIKGGGKRKLGKLAGKPEPWFEKLGFTQMEFPEADHVYGPGHKADFSVVKTILQDVKSPKIRAILLEGMSKNIIQDIVDRVYPQIVNDLGKSKYQIAAPIVELHKDIYARLSGIPGSTGEESESSIAQYDDEENKIFIYYPNMNNEEHIIRSLLHEYTHSLQDPKKRKKHGEFGYENNPYEIAAAKAERNWKDYL
mgnify:CR=1 FL=1|tara:strand:+ start:677 stop:1858 length:1182 start_codon:yes stop_codon:yes gene_type:complete